MAFCHAIHGVYFEVQVSKQGVEIACYPSLSMVKYMQYMRLAIWGGVK